MITYFLLTYASYNLSHDCLNAFDGDFYTPSQITFVVTQLMTPTTSSLKAPDQSDLASASVDVRDSIGAGHHGVKLLVVYLL